jgi:hypothetical protein
MPCLSEDAFDNIAATSLGRDKKCQKKEKELVLTRRYAHRRRWEHVQEAFGAAATIGKN